MGAPIFIQFETKTREFDSRLLLICHLLKAGFSEIYFGSKGGVQKESRYHDFGIYVFKGLTRSAYDIYKELKRKGYKIILMHVEGGIYYKDIEKSILSAFPPDLLDLVDKIFVFGTVIKEAIIKYCGNKFYDNIIISGEPRFDMLKPKYRYFFKYRISYLNKNYKDFILINTNFSAGNPVIGKNKIKEYWNNELTLTDETKKSLFEKMVFQECLIEDFIYVVKLLSKSFTNKKFVVRPHPSESETIYLKAFKGCPNIYVSKYGNVAEWILASAGVIHYDCTTGMEAVLAGKPTISYIPRQNERILAWLPIELSLKVNDANGLLRSVNDIFEGKYQHRLEQKVIKQWGEIVNNVNESSSEIIAGELFKYNSLSTTRKLPLQYGLYYDRYLSFVLVIIRRLKRKLIERKNPFNKLNKFENCRKKEVISKMRLLLEIEKFDVKFKVCQVRSDVVLIKKTD